jgi:hypothetical protein
MPRLVHLAPDHVARKVARSGINATRFRPTLAEREFDRAVWAFPVLPSYTLSYQWLRELKRRERSPRTIMAVTFRIADDERVYVRHYSEVPVAMTAAEAVGLILRHPNPLGYEIMVPRRIEAKEIVRVTTPPQRIGWRTNTKRQTFACSCPVCIPPGLPKSTRRRAYAEKRMRSTG